jgi:hypothetical protein
MSKLQKCLSFDIETAVEFPASAPDWRPYRPLGIACAATLASDQAAARLWHGRTADGAPAPRMLKADAAALVDYLAGMAAEGYTILTWNGLAFDFDILAEESAAEDLCKRLAWDHVDMMFHVFCKQGYRVALDKAAQGMGIPGKTQGMSGILAPQLWAAGRYQEVFDYVIQDVRVALNLGQKCQQAGKFRWITQKGTRQSLDLPDGWLAAKTAFLLPRPDTSWMRNPASREDFVAWLRDH